MKKTSLGVNWYMFLKDKGRYAKMPFANTTVASSDLIIYLGAGGMTWNQAFDAIIYDDEAKSVCLEFVRAGYGDVQVSEMTSLDIY